MKAGDDLFGSMTTGTSSQVLVVVCSSRLPVETAPPDGVFFTSFDDLTGELLLRTGATIVLSALWTDEFDVIDLAGKLSLMGFTGRYRAVSSGVPRPGLIVSDVRRVYPFLDFRILLFSGKGRQTTWVEYDDQV